MPLLYCLFRRLLSLWVLLILCTATVTAKERVDEPLLPGLGMPAQQATLSVDAIDPEPATGRGEHALVTGQRWMVSAAHPLASQAGAKVLRQGGSAVDAAIAMQWVLNLVEPQSSGLGGGGFALVYDANNGQLTAWDGRETAPATADSQRFMKGGKPWSFSEAVNSGRSVGVPGLLHMLDAMHQQYGELPWSDLAQPAIALAETGFPVSPRLHQLLEGQEALRDQPAAANYFYDPSGQAWPVGHKLTNPALADTLRRIAHEGPEAFYTGQLAQDTVAAVAQHDVPGDLSTRDLAAYQSKQRQPLCMPYKEVEICGMPAPSSGPLAIMQMLGILSHTPIAGLAPNDLMAVHYFAEAGRLAYADRQRYVADPDFIDVPEAALVAPNYLRERANLIRDDESMGLAKPGQLSGSTRSFGADVTQEQASTTHLVAADDQGNVVSMTTSIEAAFGSKILVNGFLLNNQLTDFSLVDTDAQGRPIANRVEPGKRPRSSMAPVMVMQNGQPLLALGSPGGPAIIHYVANVLIGVLDWGLNIQEAIDLPHRGNPNGATGLEKGTELTGLVDELEAMGHEVMIRDFPSGLQAVAFTPDGLQGAADPRREGRAIGR